MKVYLDCTIINGKTHDNPSFEHHVQMQFPIYLYST